MKTKRCPICETEKKVSEFHSYFSKPRNKTRTGNYCKSCAKTESNRRAKEHYQKNKSKKKDYAKRYRKENQDKLKNRRESLEDGYVADKAAKSLKCSTKEIHENPELLEAYRNNMKLKRKIRNYGKK